MTRERDQHQDDGQPRATLQQRRPVVEILCLVGRLVERRRAAADRLDRLGLDQCGRRSRAPRRSRAGTAARTARTGAGSRGANAWRSPAVAAWPCMSLNGMDVDRAQREQLVARRLRVLADQQADDPQERSDRTAGRTATGSAASGCWPAACRSRPGAPPSAARRLRYACGCRGGWTRRGTPRRSVRSSCDSRRARCASRGRCRRRTAAGRGRARRARPRRRGGSACPRC